MTANTSFLILVYACLFAAIIGFAECFQQHHRTIASHHKSLLLYATRGEDTPPPGEQYSTYLATCVPGLAHVLQREVEDLRPKLSDFDGITDVKQSGNAAVTFEATREGSLYALCWLRSAHRLLELVAATEESNNMGGGRFNSDNIDRDALLYTKDDLFNFVQHSVNAKDLLGDGKGGLLTLSVKTILNNPRQLPKDLSHSHYTALSIKNSLCDVVRDMRGDRPDVDVDNPDLPLVAILRGMGDSRFDDGAASLSIYKSLHPPGSLHKRGYRSGGAMHKAAMKESMAAGLLLEAGWNEKVQDVIAVTDREGSALKKLSMVDPMAGSGSLVLEACMMACDISPGLMRIRCGIPNHSNPPVTRWKANQQENVEAAWKEVLLDATNRAKAGIKRMREHPSLIEIEGNDMHPRAVEIMETSLEAAGLAKFVRLSNMDCYDMDGRKDDESDENTSNCEYFVATNPPWGVRLTEDIAESWEGLRHFIRDKMPNGTQVYVLSGDKTATAALKLKRDRMIPIQTGDQHLRWIQYTIGQKKKGNQTRYSKQPSTGGNSAKVTEAESEDSWV